MMSKLVTAQSPEDTIGKDNAVPGTGEVGEASELLDTVYGLLATLVSHFLNILSELGDALSATLPVHDPLLIFALAIVIFLIAPLTLERFRLPGIIGIILVGALIGPNAANIIEHDATIKLFGDVGLIYLMFIAGLEINLNQLIEHKNRSMIFGILSFIIPQSIGTVVGIYVLELSLPAAFLFASIFASHTLLAYPVIARLGIVKNEAITITIGGTILTDTLALLVLAVVIASEQGDLGWAFWAQLTIGLTLFFASVWIIVPRLGRWFFRYLNEESYFEFLFVMSVLFVCAYLSEIAGVEPIIGAFLAGLVLNRLIPESGPLMNRIEFVGNALFIPFFLLSVGMLVDASVIVEGTDTLIIAGSLICLVFITKLLAAWLTGKIYGYNLAQILSMFGLSLGQAAAALAIVLIGINHGLFDQNMVNGVILMILVVSVASPAIVGRYGRAIALAEETRGYDPKTAPQRVLVPLSANAKNKENLLYLALLLRESDSEEPLRALTVVQPNSGLDLQPNSDLNSKLVHAEKDLDQAKKYAAIAEVPVESLKRVDHNIASGIVRAVVENRITTIIIGWDGARSRKHSMFGSIIDQVLWRTKQLVLVARIRESLNTTKRIMIILPPDIDHNVGFLEAVHSIKMIADYTGTLVIGLVIEGNPEQFAHLFRLVKPQASCEFHRINDWKSLLPILRHSYDIGEDDLVICVSARRGTLGWHPQLQTLPKRISTLVNNFIIYYPPTEKLTDDRRFLKLR